MTGDERTGEVDVLAEGVRLRFRRRWPRPVDDVWAALTEPDRLARWIGTYDGLREPGGTGVFTMTHEDEPAGERLRVVACAAPVRLVVEWDTEAGWRVDLDLDSEGRETVLTFTQLFPAGTDVAEYALG
ncbi:SRPBCC domain-containing protein [Modestobacter sp. L9-4]|uniref:SRPBCC domain-containing protein n=1 Tax=Modestobacter sp. L9-4 TaxID=2851567 RepID=UPI001F405BBC|nr:SRPBCC domain-containing protein [Modestobacter sp. L9-4]